MPIRVETTALPMAMASYALIRVPPPMRSGMTKTAARATYGRTSSTRPTTRTSGPFPVEEAAQSLFLFP